jgi:hypothetical protein
MSKIFAIGHFKTGTTSYSLAVRMMGLVDIHFPLKYVEHLMETGDVRWDSRYWDSMSNVNEIEYPQCDIVYPDSKFVLTTRSVDSWLKSIKKHMSMQWPPRLKRLLDWRSEVLFGCPCEINAFDEGHFRHMFLAHEEKVRDYFYGRKQQQLLILRLESNTKMEELAAFLGRRVPYPKMNAGPRSGAPGFPMLAEDATKDGYPKEPSFLQFEDLVKW